MASTREEAFLNAYMKKLGRNQHSTVLSAEKQMSGAASFGTNGIKSATMKAEIPKLKALSAEELSKIQKAAIATARAATVRAPASAAPARGKRGTTQGGAKKEASQSEKAVRSEKSETETATIQAKRAGALTDAQKAAEAPKKAQGSAKASALQGEKKSVPFLEKMAGLNSVIFSPPRDQAEDKKKKEKNWNKFLSNFAGKSGVGASGEVAMGTSKAVDFISANTKAGIGQFNQGLAKTADFLLDLTIGSDTAGALMPPVKKAIDYYKDDKSGIISNAKKVNDVLGTDTAGQMTQNVVATIPRMATAMMTGGASEVPMLGSTAMATGGLGNVAGRAAEGLMRNPSFWLSAADTVGNSYSEALSDGASKEQATAKAISNGLLSGAIEVGGGIETVGKNTGLKAALKSAAEEGAEEVEQGFADRLLSKAIYDGERPWASASDPSAVLNPVAAKNEFIGGGIVGGLLGGFQSGLNSTGVPVLTNKESTPAYTPAYGTGLRNGAVQGVPEVPYLRNTQPLAEQSRAEVPYVKSTAPGNLLDNASAEQYIKNNRGDALRGSVPVLQNSAENLTGFPVLKGLEHDGTVSTENAAERDYGRGIDGGAEPGGAGGSAVGAEGRNFSAIPQRPFRQPVNNEKTSAGYLRAGAGVQDFRDTTGSAEEFCRALDSARKENKFGLMVGNKTPQKLADSGAITFMSQDGLSGAAVTRDGDIEAVFKNPKSKVAKASYQMVITAVENGGVKLDCYGCALARNYAKTGFEPVARIPWDGDSAEAGWTYGEHDVYAMKLRDGVTAEEIADKLGLSESEGGFHAPTNEELAALPTFTDYEKALEYRDSLLPARAAPMEQSSAVIKEVPYLKSAPQKQSDAGMKEVPYLKNTPRKEAKAAPEIPYLKPPKENTVGAKESAYRHDVKTSAVQSNTFANTPMFTQAQKAVAGLDDAGKFQYDAVSEAESMDIAAQRMELDPDGERAELMESRKEWIGEDVDTSMLILEDEMKKAEASGNYGEVLKWAKKIQQSGTKAGQLVQSFAKYSRTPAGTVIGAESWLDKMGKEWAEEYPKGAELVEEVAKRLCDEYKKMGATEFEVVRRMVKEVCANRHLNVDESAQDKIAKMLSDASEKDIVDSLDRYFSCGTTGLTDEQVMNIYDLMVRANGENPGSKKAVKLQNEAFKIIADSLGGVGFQPKWDAWRYLAMLGNTRTQGKNINGNFGFGALTRFNDAMSSAIEAGAQKAGLIKTRTKSVTNMLNEKDRALRGACYADADDTAYAALTGDSNYNIKSGVEGQRRIFGKSDANIFERARKSVNASLEGADAKGMIGALDFVEGLGDGKNATKAKEFVEKANTLADKAGLNGIYGISGLRNNYADALAGWLKANKHDNSIFDAEQKLAKVKEKIAGVVPSLDATYANQLSQRRAELQKQVDALQRGRAYAIQHAQEATFHEYNFLAELLNNLSRGAAEHGIAGKVFSAGVEGILPFKKTPANILKEGVQYSPAGLLETITIESARLKKGKIDANHYIERLSKGLTGTGLMALGAFLLSQGLISAGGDEDDQKDAFDKMRGKQHYAVTIGGTSYTVDWTVPASMPVFVGAVLYDSFQEDNSNVKGGKLNKFISAASTLLEPMLDTSMLQSLNSTIEDVSYADHKLESFAVSALTNHITQIVPTLSGQVARSVDNTRRSTYTGKHGVEGDLSYLVKKTVNKIPFLSKTSEPYIDQWGREQKNLESGGAIARTAYQTLSPGYLQKDKTTAVDKEIDALYAETKENKVIPSIAPSDVQAEGGTRRLSPKEYTAFSRKRGQTAYKLIEELQNSSAYNALDSSEKADAYSDLYGLSSQIGWVETLDDYNAPSETYAKMYGLYKNGGAQDVIDYLTVGALTQGTGKGGAKTNADFYGTVFNGGWGNEAMLKTYIAAAGNTDKANQVFTDKGADMALEYVHMGMDGDFDKNGSVQKDEAVSYLDSSDLTNLQKAYLLRMMNKSWKNPWE